MYALEVTQFIILYVHGDGEEKPGVAAVYQFVIVVLDEIRVFFVPGGHQTVHLRLDPGLLRLRLVVTGGVVGREGVPPPPIIRGGGRREAGAARAGRGRDVPFRQPRLPLSILQ